MVSVMSRVLSPCAIDSADARIPTAQFAAGAGDQGPWSRRRGPLASGRKTPATATLLGEVDWPGNPAEEVCRCSRSGFMAGAVRAW